MEATRIPSGVTPQKRPLWQRIVNGATALVMPVAMLVVLPALPAQAATTTSDLTVTVSSARTEPRFSTGGVVTGVVQGAPIAKFKYILNVDTTGTTDQRSPAVGSGCSALDPGYPTVKKSGSRLSAPASNSVNVVWSSASRMRIMVPPGKVASASGT